MKTTLLILISLIISTSSCQKDTETNIEGSYTGTFERDGNTSNVELTLDKGTFEGEGATTKFPAICNGTYTISDNTVTFENACIWTADFDWSLILKGTWSFEMNGQELILTKDNGDKYTLTRQ